MKPMYLKLVNIGPYRNSEIDFSKLDAMFLISGKTGSGKTFIFDAITYALYGRLPKGHEGRSRELRSTYSSDSDEAFIEYVYALGECKYRLLRNLAFTKAGNKNQTPEDLSVQRFNDEKSRFEEAYGGLSRKEKTDKIIDTIGLSCEEFSKLIVLPQGEFSAFLKQSTTEKQVTLEKLFPIDFYSAVMEEVKTRADEAEDALKALDAAIREKKESAEYDTAEVRLKEFDERLQKIAAFLKKQEQEKEESIKKSTALQEEKKIIVDLENKKNEKKELERRADDVRQKELQLEKHNKAQSLKAPLDSIAKTEADIKDAESRRRAAAKNLRESKAEQERLVSIKDDIVRQRAKIKELEEKSRDINKKIAKVGKFNKVRFRRDKAETKLQKAEKDKTSIAAEIDKIEKQLEKLKKTHAPAPSGKTTHRQFLSALNVELKKYDGELNDLKDKEKTAAQKEKIEKEIEAARVELKKIDERLRLAVGQKNNLETVKENNVAYFLSLKLEKGKPCPVCGSKTHP